MIFNILAFSVGVVVGLWWQATRIRREHERRAAFLRHLQQMRQVR